MTKRGDKVRVRLLSNRFDDRRKLFDNKTGNEKYTVSKVSQGIVWLKEFPGVRFTDDEVWEG